VSAAGLWQTAILPLGAGFPPSNKNGTSALEALNMKPFTGVTRLWRCGFAARIGHSFFLPAKQLFSSARCMETPEASRVLDKSPEPLSNEVSGAKAETAGKKARIFWTEDELRKLKDAHSQGLTPKGASAMFPTRSPASIRKKYRDLGPHDRPHVKIGTTITPWSAVEIHLLQELIADGAPERTMLAHFPTRSQTSVTMAVMRYRNENHAGSSRKYGKWSAEDYQHITQLALQGSNKYEIAESLGRTLGSVSHRIYRSGIRIQKTRIPYTPEMKKQLIQMRSDGVPYEDIATALGRSTGTLQNLYHDIRPVTEHDVKTRHKPFARLSLNDLQAVRSMRDEGASWPDIGRQYPEHNLGGLRNSFALFTKPGLSSMDMLEIGRLRGEGKSWKHLAGTGNYTPTSGHGLAYAYRRGLEKQKLPSAAAVRRVV
jgi:DNA-directed RNA polymerase specialized sigma24 family protein